MNVESMCVCMYVCIHYLHPLKRYWLLDLRKESLHGPGWIGGPIDTGRQGGGVQEEEE